jgi:hypothetical protein
MMPSDIGEHILTHDFVMLPGIGAFVAEYSRPYFSESGDIIPGERTLRFNPLLRNDSDVSLLEALREKQLLSIEEVQDKYFAFLDQVMEDLEKKGEYQWDGLGRLMLLNGEINFKPLEKKVVQERIISEDLPVVEEDEKVEEEASENKTAKYLIFALPLVLLSAALVYMVFFKPSRREVVKEKEPELSLPEEVIVDTLSTDTVTYINPEEIENYRVDIGIYKREKDAAKIVAFLESKGYRPKVRPHGPLYKVFLPASSEEQARRYVKDVGKLIDDTPVYVRL